MFDKQAPICLFLYSQLFKVKERGHKFQSLNCKNPSAQLPLAPCLCLFVGLPYATQLMECAQWLICLPTSVHPSNGVRLFNELGKVQRPDFQNSEPSLHQEDILYLIFIRKKLLIILELVNLGQACFIGPGRTAQCIIMQRKHGFEKTLPDTIGGQARPKYLSGHPIRSTKSFIVNFKKSDNFK